MDAQIRQRYMQAMGIPVWLPKSQVVGKSAPAKSSLTQHRQGAEQALAALLDIAKPSTSIKEVVSSRILPAVGVAVKAESSCASMGWEELRTAVSVCQRCGLSKTRTQTVFGTGNTEAQWMIIGEAPGADEDRLGEPFVGKAGQLLNNMLIAMGLQREAVSIANVLKCRPPNNRDPQPAEVASCRGYLERQIELVNPSLILVVGRIAAQNLLQTQAPLARLRQQVHRYPLLGTPIVVTYHPAYLLRQPADKRKAWQDLQFAKEVLTQHVD